MANKTLKRKCNYTRIAQFIPHPFPSGIVGTDSPDPTCGFGGSNFHPRDAEIEDVGESVSTHHEILEKRNRRWRHVLCGGSRWKSCRAHWDTMARGELAKVKVYDDRCRNVWSARQLDKMPSDVM